MKFCVVGTGYVGLSIAVLLSQKYDVAALDIAKERVDLINKKKSPIKDIELENYISKKKLNLYCTTDKEEAINNADYVIIATPTNYDPQSGSFDTSKVETVISDAIEINKDTNIVIKSTIPFGFTRNIRRHFNKENIFFSPEFLRESKALYDNLYPSRIVVGDTSDQAIVFGKTLVECSNVSEGDVPLFFMDPNEAEAVKLFANTFLAMRISFFNELDSFSEIQQINSEKIISAICADHRIGNYYNNPSFGYGGYCLPKDTKQLLHSFNDISNNIISAVVDSNETRKDFIVQSIIEKSPSIVGVYRLIMKQGSDNYRESAILDIINKLKNKDVTIILYEPFIKESLWQNIEVISDLKEFTSKSDLIIANRFSKDLDHVMNKVYTRDIFNEN